MSLEFSVVEPYVHNFLKKHYWKVETLLSYEDALSEAKLQFVRTFSRLEKRNCVVENEKHLMALFKTSWSNHFITLSNKATHERFITPSHSAESHEILMNQLSDDSDNYGELEIVLQQAPSEIKQVLTMLMNSPAEVVEVIRDCFFSNPSKSNMLLCRLLGKNPDAVNLVQKTLDYLDVRL